MKPKDSTMPNLDYRGGGFFVYDDNSNERMSDFKVCRKVARHLGKRVTHICKNGYVGYRRHVVQLTHLFEKDQKRQMLKLQKRFNHEKEN